MLSLSLSFKVYDVELGFLKMSFTISWWPIEILRSLAISTKHHKVVIPNHSRDLESPCGQKMLKLLSSDEEKNNFLMVLKSNCLSNNEVTESLQDSGYFLST